MLARCYQKSNIGFPAYGGRGISVCDRWRLGEAGRSGFECFLVDMGLKPSPGHSLDRANNDGNYEPGNCRWVTNKDQALNRRTNHWVMYRGERMTIGAAAAAAGLKRTTVHQRMRRGATLEAALSARS